MAAERLRLRRNLVRPTVPVPEGGPNLHAHPARKAAFAKQSAASPPVGKPDSEADKRPTATLPEVAGARRAATEDERPRESGSRSGS